MNSEYLAFQCQDSELSIIWKRMKKLVISMVFQQIIAVLSFAFPSKIYFLCLMIVKTLLSLCCKIYVTKFCVTCSVSGHLVSLAFSRLIAMFWKVFGGLNSLSLTCWSIYFYVWNLWKDKNQWLTSWSNGNTIVAQSSTWTCLNWLYCDLPTTPCGHKHILVTNDQFSKFLSVIPWRIGLCKPHVNIFLIIV